MFGRKRYFSGVSDRSYYDQSGVRREAKNSRLQSGCADLLSQAAGNLHKIKYHTEIGSMVDFKCLLPIHDAYLFEVREEHLPMFLKILDSCMSTQNKIPGTDFYLKLDVEVMHRWGEKHAA